MIGDGAVVAGGDLLDAERVDEKAHEFPAFARERHGLARGVRLVGEQFGIVLRSMPAQDPLGATT